MHVGTGALAGQWSSRKGPAATLLPPCSTPIAPGRESWRDMSLASRREPTKALQRIQRFVSSPSSHSAGHRCPAHPSDHPCRTLPVTGHFQLGQCEQAPRRPTAKAVAHWAASRSLSKASTVRYPYQATTMAMATTVLSDWRARWEARCVRHEGRMCCGCRAGKPNVLQRADQRNRQHFRGQPFCATAWAGSGNGNETERALLATVGQPSIREYRTNIPTLAHRTSYLTTTGASADRVFASATNQTDCFSQDREASKL